MDSIEDLIGELRTDAARAWPEVTIAFDPAQKVVTYVFSLNPQARLAFTTWLDDWFRALSARQPVQRRRVATVSETIVDSPVPMTAVVDRIATTHGCERFVGGEAGDDTGDA